MAPSTNGTISTEFEQHQREVVNTFARAALAMRDAAKVAEEFSNWFARANNMKDIPPPIFSFGLTALPSSDTAVAGKKRKADDASPLDKNGKKKPPARKARDKDAPKRPLTAYLLFQNEVRKEIKNEHPDMSNIELMREVSRLWHTVSEKEKEMYLERSEALKSKYEDEIAAYESKQGATPDGPTLVENKGEKPKKATKKASTAIPPKESTSATVPETKPVVSDGSDEEDEIELESEAEVTEEEEHEERGNDLDESEAEPEMDSEPEPPKKKAKSDIAHSNLRKSPPAAKDKKSKKDKHEEEKKKKKH